MVSASFTSNTSLWIPHPKSGRITRSFGAVARMIQIESSILRSSLDSRTSESESLRSTGHCHPLPRKSTFIISSDSIDVHHRPLNGHDGVGCYVHCRVRCDAHCARSLNAHGPLRRHVQRAVGLDVQVGFRSDINSVGLQLHPAG